MNILLKLFRGSQAFAFKSWLLILGILGPLIMFFGTPVQLKTALHNSGAYDTVVTSGLKATVTQVNKDPKAAEGDSPAKLLSDPSAQACVQKAFPPPFLESSVNQVVDGVYGWLNGKTAKPEFSINIVTAKQTLADCLGEYAVTRMSSLPVCKKGQNGNSDSPFDATCKPTDFSAAKVHAEIQKTITKQTDFLPNGIITADNLGKNKDGDSGQNPFDKIGNKASKVFKVVTKAPLILGALVFLSGGLLFLTHTNKRRALKVIAVTFLSTGGFLALNAIVTKLVIDHLVSSGTLTNKLDSSFTKSINNLVKTIGDRICLNFIIYSAIFVAVGAVLLAVRHFATRKPLKADHPKAAEPKPPIDDSPKISEMAAKTEKTEEPQKETEHKKHDQEKKK